MNIKLPRGDLRKYKFTLKDKFDKPLNVEIKEIYITFKNDFNEKDYLFQKKYSSGDITKDDNNYYYFSIRPEDTNNLFYGEYVFDIELIGNELKQTILGKLILTQEVTFADNEE